MFYVLRIFVPWNDVHNHHHTTNVPFERVKEDLIARTTFLIDVQLDDIPIYSYILFCSSWYFVSINFSTNKNVKQESSEQCLFFLIVTPCSNTKYINEIDFFCKLEFFLFQIPSVKLECSLFFTLVKKNIEVSTVLLKKKRLYEFSIFFFF